MRSNWNSFQTALIAKKCGLSIPELDLDWQNWIDSLSGDDSLILQGALIANFGRSHYASASKQIDRYALTHLSQLESEFYDWLNRPQEVIDYVIASKCTDKSISVVYWYWLESHQQLWKFRGYTDTGIPHGIRLLPLVENSLDSVLSRHLNKIIEQFLLKLGSDLNNAKKLIEYVEAGCQYFGRSAQDILDARLDPLKKSVDDHNRLETQKWANRGEDRRENQKGLEDQRWWEDQRRLEDQRRRENDQKLDWRHVLNAEK